MFECVYFKYLGFAWKNFQSCFSLGVTNELNHFQNIMPLGISFFTFKLKSYVIEVIGENQSKRDIAPLAPSLHSFPTIYVGSH